MAHAKLHIICGNCGSNEYLRYHVEEGGEVTPGVIEQPDVYLVCENCATLHELRDTVPEKPVGHGKRVNESG